MPHFIIDCLPESASRYRARGAIVAIDVIRATTMAVTAVAMGRRCFPVPSLADALRLASTLEDPLLAGEIAGEMPPGLHLNNSPAALAQRRDISRPLVMVSSSGTRLIANARGCDALYLGCFRNASALATRIIEDAHSAVALLGAGSRGEFREEDQICCAWIGVRLLRAGYQPGNAATREVLRRWALAAACDCLVSRSVDYLVRTNQLADLLFILDHVDDVDAAFLVEENEVRIGRRTFASHAKGAYTPVSQGSLA
jgi:2-phosphosulfolactate phosphatase